jgi:hypothetical protein
MFRSVNDHLQKANNNKQRKEKQLNNKHSLYSLYSLYRLYSIKKKKKTLPGPPRAAIYPYLQLIEGAQRHGHLRFKILNIKNFITILTSPHFSLIKNIYTCI